MKPVFNFQFSKGFAKLCFNTCSLNQNKNWSVRDEIFHSKTSINIHLIKIYHNPVSVLNWNPMQTHRGRNKRDKQRERGARETNRRGSGQIWKPRSNATATLGMVLHRHHWEFYGVCVWERGTETETDRNRGERN